MRGAAGTAADRLPFKRLRDGSPRRSSRWTAYAEVDGHPTERQRARRARAPFGVAR